MAQYYSTLALAPPGPQLNLEPAIKTAYWGSVAAQVDPDPTVRARSKELVDTILSAAPGLQSDLTTMLATRCRRLPSSGLVLANSGVSCSD